MSRPLRPRRFSSLLTLILVTFQGFSMAVVLVFLFEIMRSTQTAEFHNRVQAHAVYLDREYSKEIDGLKTSLEALSKIPELPGVLLGEEGDGLAGVLKEAWPTRADRECRVWSEKDQEFTPPLPPGYEQLRERFLSNPDTTSPRFIPIGDRSLLWMTWPIVTETLDGTGALVPQRIGTALVTLDLARNSRFSELRDAELVPRVIMRYGAEVVDIHSGVRRPAGDLVFVEGDIYSEPDGSELVVTLPQTQAISIAVSTAPLQDKHRKLVEMMVFICITISLLSLLIAWWLVKRLSGPLDDLVKQAMRIAAVPDRSLSLEQLPYTEFRNLGAAFNQMLGSTFKALTAVEEKANEVEQLNLDLEFRVSERTRELQERNTALQLEIERRMAMQSELSLAKDRAEAADRAKSEFLANMSHEIRTPMNGIMGMTQLLEETDLAQDQRFYVDTVSSCAEGLLQIINDILDFSKIEAGKLEMEAISFDLVTALEEVTDLLAPRAVEKELVLVGEVPLDLPVRVLGDPTRLRQILVNFLNNAIKFTLEGHIVLRVRMLEDDQVRFEVEDTGIGIPPDRLDAIFDSFSQVDASTTRKYGGTGLGLAISRRLASLMGGEVGVESEPGQGSTFWFTARLRPQGPLYRDAIVDRNRRGHSAMVLASDPLRWTLVERLRSLGYDAAGTSHAPRTPDADWVFIEVSTPERLAVAESLVADGQAERVVAIVPVGQSVPTSISASPCTVLNQPMRVAPLLELLGLELPAPAPVPVEEEATAVSPYQGLRILLVEDNVVNQRVTLTILQKMGVITEVANNGVEAVAHCREQVFDVILMDCQMPEMDGFQATREIRALEGDTRHTPIIALTANALKGDRERCFESGMDAYVSKPVRKSELTDAISEAVLT